MQILLIMFVCSYFYCAMCFVGWFLEARHRGYWNLELMLFFFFWRCQLSFECVCCVFGADLLVMNDELPHIIDISQILLTPYSLWHWALDVIVWFAAKTMRKHSFISLNPKGRGNCSTRHVSEIFYPKWPINVRTPMVSAVTRRPSEG